MYGLSNINPASDINFSCQDSREAREKTLLPISNMSVSGPQPSKAPDYDEKGISLRKVSHCFPGPAGWQLELNTAAEAGDWQRAKEILSEDVVNNLDIDSISMALKKAAECGAVEVIELFLEKIDINDHSFSEYDSPLSRAAGNGHLEVLKWLLERFPKSSLEEPLRWAASGGQLETVKWLVEEKKASASGSPFHSLSPLREAVRGRHYPVVEFLINSGADVNFCYKGSAVEDACSYGHYEILRLLLDNGGNPDSGQFGPLVVAAGSGRLDCVKLLLDKRGDVNHEECNNGTALLAAARHGHTSVAELLLKHGADVNNGGVNSESPLVGAVTRGHVDVANLLLEHKGKLVVATTGSLASIYKACQEPIPFASISIPLVDGRITDKQIEALKLLQALPDDESEAKNKASDI